MPMISGIAQIAVHVIAVDYDPGYRVYLTQRCCCGALDSTATYAENILDFEVVHIL